jgi:hypothetical protein
MSLTAPPPSLLYTSPSKLQKITLIDKFSTQFALREKHSNQAMKLFDKKVLSLMSGLRKEKVRVARVKLHSDILHNLYSSLDVT